MNLRGLLASPLGLLVGVVMGALGGGGAVLAVPVLVYVAGQDPTDATASALLIVMCAAIGGLVPTAGQGYVRWGFGFIFGAAGIVGSVSGSALNHLVNENVLLLAFSGLLLVVAGVMFQQARHAGDDEDDDRVAPPLRGDPGTVVKVVVAGTGIGLLTGFFGVGGGFVIVPTLTVFFRFPVRQAVGTSLLIISINSLVALIARQAWGSIEWSVAIPFTVAALIGVVAGNKLAQRAQSRVLVRAFGYLLIGVALYTGIRSALAL